MIRATTGKKPAGTVDVEIRIKTGETPLPSLNVTYSTNEDSRERALAIRRILLPWSKPASLDPSDAETAEPKPIPELAGGNWSRGRAVFHSDQAMCAKCHVIRADGAGHIGPDLSNLHHRDYASVLKDVLFPSAAINPDHVAYVITLTDGNTHGGVPRSDGNVFVIIGEPGGQETRVARSSIKSMEPMSTSIMPHGIDQVIGKDALRDLMTFLLAPPLEPAKIEVKGVEPPPLRKQAELDAVLKSSRDAGIPPVPKNKTTQKPTPPKVLKILLAAGPKEHGPGEHDYPLWQKRRKELFSRAENVEIDNCFGWPEQKQFDAADVIIWFSNNPGWGRDKAPQLEAFLNRGGGMIYLHYAVDGHDAPDVLAKYIGLAWKGGASKFRHGALDMAFPDQNHPITRNFEKVKFLDESYWQLVGDPGKIHVLATNIEDNAPQPLMWTIEPLGPEKGRVFVNILGHYNWTFDDPLFRVLLLRGIAWCAREPDIERLSALATPGARIVPPGRK
jgi:putative heme-binding domain-containing protein